MGNVIFLKRLKVGVMTIVSELDVKKNTYINEKADEIRNDYRLITFPIDPAIITRELNIDVVEVTFKKHNGYEVSGGIIRDSNKFKIYVNSQDSMKRKRFTIAHELGHYFLEHLDNKGQYVDLHREVSSNKTPEEIDADEFAACLLMPEAFLKSKLSMLKSLGFDDVSIINRLSDIFFVSQSAMKYRLSNLRLI